MSGHLAGRVVASAPWTVALRTTPRALASVVVGDAMKRKELDGSAEEEESLTGVKHASSMPSPQLISSTGSRSTTRH